MHDIVEIPERSTNHWINPSQLVQSEHQPSTPVRSGSDHRRASAVSTFTDSAFSSTSTLSNADQSLPTTPQSLKLIGHGHEVSRVDCLPSTPLSLRQLRCSTSPAYGQCFTETCWSNDDFSSPYDWSSQVWSDSKSPHSEPKYGRLGSKPSIMETENAMNLDMASFASPARYIVGSALESPFQSYGNIDSCALFHETPSMDSSFCNLREASFSSADILTPDGSHCSSELLDPVMSLSDSPDHSFIFHGIDESYPSSLDYMSMEYQAAQIPTMSPYEYQLVDNMDAFQNVKHEEIDSRTKRTRGRSLGSGRISKSKPQQRVRQQPKRSTKANETHSAINSYLNTGNSNLDFPIDIAPGNESKRYQCAECDRRFKRAEHRSRHEISHSPTRKYGCALAKAGGDEWCNIESSRTSAKNKDTANTKAPGISRSDNQLQHYITHVQFSESGEKPRNNKCCARLFFYWLIVQYDGDRALHVIDKVERSLVEKSKKNKHDISRTANEELMRQHPEYPEFFEWWQAGNSYEDLGVQVTVDEKHEYKPALTS